MISPSKSKHVRDLQFSSPLATSKAQSFAVLRSSIAKSSEDILRRKNSRKSTSSDAVCIPSNSIRVYGPCTEPVTAEPIQALDQEENVIGYHDEAAHTKRTMSISAQTSPDDVKEITTERDDIPLPLAAIKLHSILIAARAKSASKMSPKQYAVYQLSNDIIIMIQQSLQSERNAFGFVGRPIISVVGEQIDRMAWWFWVVEQAVQELNPPRGYILPALKMLRQEISSLADIAVEIIGVQKTIQKQLHRMANILNTVFARHEDLFGVREWEQKLQQLRAEDAAEVEEKFEKWLRQTEEGAVKLTVFENKSMLVQHETNGEFRPITLSKLSLKSQKEFIKSCLDHMSSVLRWSCDHSVQSHEELLKAEKEIQENIDKLVKKLDNLRKVHRFRDSTCAYLLKKSLHTLGLCFYEFIDMVRFIRKLGRFVLLASEHVLRHANGWSNLCDATCLAQLDVVIEEFAKNNRSGLLKCFACRIKSGEQRNSIMSTFEEYFQRWISANLSTVQVTMPMSNESAFIVFGDARTSSSDRVCLRRKLRGESKRKKESVPSVVSTKELEVKVIHSCAHLRKKADQTREAAQKLEEIGIKISDPVEVVHGCTLEPNSMGAAGSTGEQPCISSKTLSKSITYNSASKSETLKPT